MKKISLLLAIAVSILALYACKSQAPDAHNARNSLDWTGVYSGTIPSASGSGIHVILTLLSDNPDDLRYTIRYEYIDRKDGIFTSKGTFTWDKDGNTITLAVDAKKFPTKYEVGENKLTQFDTAGERITGPLADDYVLTKRFE